MKKLFISALVALSLTVSSFAADVSKVNAKAARSFSVEFADAENPTWTSTENYVRVSFTLNDKKMEAYYDHDGNMVGTSNMIELADLPTSAKRSFAKRYAGYTVKEAIQFDGANETSYYISAENEAQSVVLKVSAEGFVSVFKKVNK